MGRMSMLKVGHKKASAERSCRVTRLDHLQKVIDVTSCYGVW
jgi:hypothetical protein